MFLSSGTLKEKSPEPEKRNGVVERIRHLKEMAACGSPLGGEEGPGCLGPL